MLCPAVLCSAVALYEAEGEPVDEATIKLWHAGEGEAANSAAYLPQGALAAAVAVAGGVEGASPITDAELAKLRTSCNPFIEWLNSAEEDDDEEEEDED